MSKYSQENCRWKRKRRTWEDLVLSQSWRD